MLWNSNITKDELSKIPFLIAPCYFAKYNRTSTYTFGLPNLTKWAYFVLFLSLLFCISHITRKEVVTSSRIVTNAVNLTPCFSFMIWFLFLQITDQATPPQAKKLLPAAGLSQMLSGWDMQTQVSYMLYSRVFNHVWFIRHRLLLLCFAKCTLWLIKNVINDDGISKSLDLKTFSVCISRERG